MREIYQCVVRYGVMRAVRAGEARISQHARHFDGPVLRSGTNWSLDLSPSPLGDVSATDGRIESRGIADLSSLRPHIGPTIVPTTSIRWGCHVAAGSSHPSASFQAAPYSHTPSSTMNISDDALARSSCSWIDVAMSLLVPAPSLTGEARSVKNTNPWLRDPHF